MRPRLLTGGEMGGTAPSTALVHLDDTEAGRLRDRGGTRWATTQRRTHAELQTYRGDQWNAQLNV